MSDSVPVAAPTVTADTMTVGDETFPVIVVAVPNLATIILPLTAARTLALDILDAIDVADPPRAGVPGQTDGEPS